MTVARDATMRDAWPTGMLHQPWQFCWRISARMVTTWNTTYLVTILVRLGMSRGTRVISPRPAIVGAREVDGQWLRQTFSWAQPPARLPSMTSSAPRRPLILTRWGADLPRISRKPRSIVPPLCRVFVVAGLTASLSHAVYIAHALRETTKKRVAILAGKVRRLEIGPETIYHYQPPRQSYRLTPYRVLHDAPAHSLLGCTRNALRTYLPGEGEADHSPENQGHEELGHVRQVGTGCLAHLPCVPQQ